MEPFLVVGTLVDSREDWSLNIMENAMLVIGREGNILYRDTNAPGRLKDVMERFSIDEDHLIEMDATEFLLPGLVDSHIHASQLPNAGLALNLPLLDWLQEYTFPMEANFSDLHFARRVYEHAVDTTLTYGTTTACYHSTIHLEATKLLGQIARDKGQRAVVGKVCMNQNGFGDYVESTTDSLTSTREFLTAFDGTDALVTPALTPRFAIACDRSLLAGLGDLAKAKNLRIQTHLAESEEEVALVKQLFPTSTSYSDVYWKTGLLTSRTILAHGIHLEDVELKMLKETGAGISHCPNSNCSIRSGNMDVRRAVGAGVKVGLGTDCSAGYSPSMINSMRFALSVSNQLFIASSDPSYKPMNFADVIYLATKGSAKVASLDHKVGSLDVGKSFDAIRVRLATPHNRGTQLFGHESTRDLVQKFVFLGDDRNIVQVWVQGMKVKDLLNVDSM